jgi:hypothetical protein
VADGLGRPFQNRKLRAMPAKWRRNGRRYGPATWSF